MTTIFGDRIRLTKTETDPVGGYFLRSRSSASVR